MDIKIYGKHLQVTPAMENYIKDKFSQIALPEKINAVEFTVGVEKDNQFVHLDTRVAQEDIHLEAQANSFYAAVDALHDKIKKTFVKLKEKKNIHLKP